MTGHNEKASIDRSQPEQGPSYSLTYKYIRGKARMWKVELHLVLELLNMIKE